jgi:hypothetical protein
MMEYDVAGGRGNMRWMATLAYANPLYDSPGPPTSKEGISAFVAFTIAAVRRYQGRGVLWELWCEPNGVFWDKHGAPGNPAGDGNSTQYVKLARAVGEGVAAAGLGGEFFIGPNTAMWWQYDVDLPYLEACLKGGVLKYWSAINLHLYRASAPETVQDTYRKVRALIQRYLPANTDMPPLISGEWGCTSWHPQRPLLLPLLLTGSVPADSPSSDDRLGPNLGGERGLLPVHRPDRHDEPGQVSRKAVAGQRNGGCAIHLVQVPEWPRRPQQQR